MKISYLSHVPFFCEGVQFSRGTQNVTDDELKNLMRNPIFQMRLRKGDFLIENLADVKNKFVPEKSTDSKAEEVKLEAIRNATDTKGVKDLVKNETAKNILEQADKRLAELEESDRKMKDKRTSLKKAKDEAQKDDFKKEAFEQI